MVHTSLLATMQYLKLDNTKKIPYEEGAPAVDAACGTARLVFVAASFQC